MKFDKLVCFFEIFKTPIIMAKKMFIKKEMAVKITTVPTKGFVGTAILLLVDLAVNCTILKTAAIIKATLQINTILENVRMRFNLFFSPQRKELKEFSQSY